MMREIIYSGKCSKHGVWNSNKYDGCPQCARDDYYQEMDEESRHWGICFNCKYVNINRQHACIHPKRKQYPTKPRKRRCVYYQEDQRIGEDD